MKQTAVDWYEKEINSLFEKYEAKQISPRDFLIMKHNLFYPAKQMEKEQIVEAYESGVWDVGCRNSDSKKYYNETYGHE